ncbi:MAG: phosphopyruvate hydratase [Bryobacterales bacterium]|nr:phosphopyruvate hydratase [Bryobacterales bacterium]
MKIVSLQAWEILDSRGNPTVAAACQLSTGVRARAHAPSGASTGMHEACELRDHDGGRYAGKGVRRAVHNVNEAIAKRLVGMRADEQWRLDQAMIDLDGTTNKSRLGANAILAVSCAVARAAAVQAGVPLWKWLAAGREAKLPVPMVNILSGGHHAGHNFEFQDFLAMPVDVAGYGDQLEAIVAVHRETRHLLDKAGYVLTGVADEGGWGPKLPANRMALDILSQAIDGCALEGRMKIALDVAASHFYKDGHYALPTENRSFDAAGMVGELEKLCDEYPVISIEDGLAEDDWSGWQMLTARLGQRVQLVGDDFFTTNIGRLNRGIAENCANAVLVKMNQIGTLTETFGVIDRAREAGYRAVISARSGETEDDFLADLATASGAGQIKVGSITRSERLAKYNRLFEIERELTSAA